MSKKLVILYLLVIVFIFTACSTGGREINTLGMVIATGFDFENGKVIVTNEVLNPTYGEESKNAETQENTLFVQGIGNSITEASANTSLTFDRELYYSHSPLIILGEGLAKKGLGAYIDILTRSIEQRETAFMLVAQNSKASDVMGVNSGMAQSPGRYVYDIIRQDKFNQESIAVTINQFFRYYFRPHEEYVLGVVRVIEKPQISKMSDNDTILVIDVEGGAAFKDDKLIGYYSGEEMFGMNFIKDRIKGGVIVFATPDYLIEKDELISDIDDFSTVRIFRSKTAKEIKLIDGKLHLDIKVKFRGSLIEDTEGVDISKPGIIQEMEKSCAKKVEAMIAKTFDKGKKFNADAFGIGELVHKKYPEIWKQVKDDWDEIFSELTYSVNVNVRFNDAGFTNTPPNILKGK